MDIRDNMEINIQNLGIIDDAKIKLLENQLTIKYGVNGIGKSTFANALRDRIEGKELSDYKKYGTDLMPVIEIDNLPNNAIVFNQKYVNQYLFKKEDLLNNSFEILINTEEYRKAQERLLSYFDKLEKSILKTNLDTIITNLSEFINIFKFKPKNIENVTVNTIQKTSKFEKGRTISEIISQAPVEIEEYLDLVQLRKNYEWIKWFDSGSQYILENKCPFCRKKLNEDFEKIRDEILNLFKSTKLKDNAESKRIIENVSKYINEKDQLMLNDAINSSEVLTSEQMNEIYNICEYCNKELIKLTNLKTLNALKIKEKYDEKSLIDFLKENKLTLAFYYHLDEENLKNLEQINEDIEDLIIKAENIELVVKEFTEKLNGIIKDKSNFINEFLKISGIPYEIEIQPVNENEFKTILKSSDNTPMQEYDSLSFGEKNAISLILFALEAEKYNLIILDDPVSSFDNHKKFALMYYLFTSNQALFKNKTVLMLTHDFSVIVDLLYKNEFKQIRKNCYYLQNEQGHLKESKINGNKVRNTLKQWKKKAEDENLNILLRIVNLRKYLEYNESANSSAYHILSSLEHLRSVMQKKDNQGQMVDMNSEEIEEGYKKIQETMPDFDYNNALNQLNNKNNLNKWYFEAKSSVDKLQIIRVFLQDVQTLTEDKVFMNFITETYHIENNEMMSLDENKFNLVPEYIMNICDQIMYKNSK